MCVVYAAHHLQLDGQVAIKLLRPDVLSEAANPDEIIERFLREGVAANQIKSEHVVRTFDVGTLESGFPFLVMEYLEGHDLDALLQAHGPLPIDAAVDYLLQAGEAIAEAHALGIVHRDLKPANLFLTHRADGSPFVKVLDFGISKIIHNRRGTRFDPALTGTANVVGTPHYMSPEQLRNSRDVDGRTDIWSLGAILHELLSGTPPFQGSTMPEICANILRDDAPSLAPLRPEVPPALEAVVQRCLEKDPMRRFSNMAQVATALADFATSAGRASAARIVGISRTQAMVDEGGILVPPPHDGPTWGATDPSWDEIPTPLVRRHQRRVRAGKVWFAAVMLAATGLLVAEWRYPNDVARLIDDGIAAVDRLAARFDVAEPAPLPSTAGSLDHGTATITPGTMPPGSATNQPPLTIDVPPVHRGAKPQQDADPEAAFVRPVVSTSVSTASVEAGAPPGAPAARARPHRARPKVRAADTTAPTDERIREVREAELFEERK